jgi:hypothetical protein
MERVWVEAAREFIRCNIAWERRRISLGPLLLSRPRQIDHAGDHPAAPANQELAGRAVGVHGLRGCAADLNHHAVLDHARGVFSGKSVMVVCEDPSVFDTEFAPPINPVLPANFWDRLDRARLPLDRRYDDPARDRINRGFKKLVEDLKSAPTQKPVAGWMTLGAATKMRECSKPEIAAGRSVRRRRGRARRAMAENFILSLPGTSKLDLSRPSA